MKTVLLTAALFLASFAQAKSADDISPRAHLVALRMIVDASYDSIVDLEKGVKESAEDYKAAGFFNLVYKSQIQQANCLAIYSTVTATYGVIAASLENGKDALATIPELNKPASLAKLKRIMNYIQDSNAAVKACREPAKSYELIKKARVSLGVAKTYLDQVAPLP